MREFMLRLTTAFCLFIAIFCTVAAQAQSFSLERDRQPIVSLDGMWRFHPGDDPGWADPAFDDSRSPVLHFGSGGAQQGYKELSGVAWYRFKVDVPAGSSPLSLYVPTIHSSYEIY